MSNSANLTLDAAIAAFRETPNEETAVNLRFVAQTYRDDEMIGEQEMWDLIAESDAVTDAAAEVSANV